PRRLRLWLGLSLRLARRLRLWLGLSLRLARRLRLWLGHSQEITPLTFPAMARQRAAMRGSAGFASSFDQIVANVERVIQGKQEAVRLGLVCMVADGHLLIEDVPGVGKTTMAQGLAASIRCEWSRIQFT